MHRQNINLKTKMSKGIPRTNIINAANAASLLITKLKYHAIATHMHITITIIRKNIKLLMFLTEIDS